jgi:hypothetical protein
MSDELQLVAFNLSALSADTKYCNCTHDKLKLVGHWAPHLFKLPYLY